MDNYAYKAVVGILLVTVFLLLLISFIAPQAATLRGYCEGKGYDGVQRIDGKWCCYRGEDSTFVAVPIKMLKGE